jgi:uncharacterized protein (TIGR02246 family)
MIFFRACLLMATIAYSLNSAFALEPSEVTAIQEIIHAYTDSWNQRDCQGFGDHFTEDADWVNVFGMLFSGRAEIEDRHVKIMQSFQKGSKLEILDTKLREVQPGLVIGLIHWRLHQGFASTDSEITKPKETREGHFMQVFINSDKKWEITASSNTLIAKPQH